MIKSKEKDFRNISNAIKMKETQPKKTMYG